MADLGLAGGERGVMNSHKKCPLAFTALLTASGFKIIMVICFLSGESTVIFHVISQKYYTAHLAAYYKVHLCFSSVKILSRFPLYHKNVNERESLLNSLLIIFTCDNFTAVVCCYVL